MARSIPSPRRSDVPMTTTESERFYQRRIALYARVMFLQSIGFAILANGLALLLEPRVVLGTVLGDAGNRLHVAAALWSLGIWFILKRRAFSVRGLSWFDAVACVGPMLLYGVMAHANAAPAARLELILLLIGNVYQLGRAVMVPSTPRYTALLGCAMCLPILVYSGMWAGTISPGSGPGRGRLLANAYTVLWCTVGIVTATVGSRVIFGLRREVREARQLGQYTLVEKLGEGGMGAVYKAHHALLRRPTAIKLLPPEKAGQENLSRFEREVQLTSQLTHPNTIAIYDYGRTPDGVFYYAMEYLDGLDLQLLVDHDGPQDPSRAVHILKQVAGALTEAHAIGLVHRDIKPANIILCERGALSDVAKVVDFGLVKNIDAGMEGASLGVTGETRIMGTPLYLSPEAIRNAPTVDARSDLYALGAVGYFLLTGTSVFQAKTVVEICSHHLHSEPVPPAERLGRELPSDLQRLLLRCLKKDPAERPQSAAELAAALRSLSVPEWTQEQAREWWMGTDPAVRARARYESGMRSAVGPHATATIAVDLKKRGLVDTDVA
ncbi:MAG TPA: serine/threonine-protein kinase [Polyangiaceae bacterium]